MTRRDTPTGGALPRGLRILECLSHLPGGASLGRLATDVGISKPATHRALTDLVDAGLVRQDPVTGHYSLTLKLLTMAYRYVQAIDLVSLARPIIEDLARCSEELVRLSIVEGDRLVFVDKAQGATSGLKYDDDLGDEANLFYTATGMAWLSQLTDKEAVRLVRLQGIDDPAKRGPNAPRDFRQFAENLRLARARGYASVNQTNEVAVSGVAAPIVVNGRPVGVLTVVGPHLRLTAEKIEAIVPDLLRSCAELAEFRHLPQRTATPRPRDLVQEGTR